MDCPTAMVSCPTVSARSPRSAVVAPHSRHGPVATNPWGEVVLQGTLALPCHDACGPGWEQPGFAGTLPPGWQPLIRRHWQRLAGAGSLRGHVLSHGQLQAGLSELASHLGGSWLQHPLRIP